MTHEANFSDQSKQPSQTHSKFSDILDLLSTPKLMNIAPKTHPQLLSNALFRAFAHNDCIWEAEHFLDEMVSLFGIRAAIGAFQSQNNYFILPVMVYRLPMIYSHALP